MMKNLFAIQEALASNAFLGLLLVGSLLFIAASPVAAWNLDEQLSNKMCPVTPEEPIETKFSLPHDGKTVYFCCNKCVRKFKQNPQAYQESLASVMPKAVATDVPTDGGHAEEGKSEGEGSDHEHDGGGHDGGGGDDHDHAAGAAHDHAKDHGQPAGVVSQAIRWVGKLHPMIVHFPVALLVLAATLEILAIMLSTTYFAVTIRILVIAAAITGVPAAAVGWANAAFGSYPEQEQWILLTHRWLGIAVAVFSVVTAVLSLKARDSANLKCCLWYRICLLTSAALVSVAGHFGASLVYGWDYLF